MMYIKSFRFAALVLNLFHVVLILVLEMAIAPNSTPAVGKGVVVVVVVTTGVVV